MTKLSVGLLIGTSAAAVGLFIDNMQLRAQLDAQPAPASEQVRSERVTKASARVPQQLASRAFIAAPDRGGVASEASEDVIEARIEREVEARVNDVVAARTDSELEAIVEERVDERLEEQRDRRRERLREMMEEHVSEFVEDNGHSDETKARMMTTLDGAMASLMDIFSAVQNEEIDRATARDEMGVVREDLELAMAEVLGTEDAERFHENLRGPLGRRWRGRR